MDEFEKKQKDLEPARLPHQVDPEQLERRPDPKADPLLVLQRTAGNRALQPMLDGSRGTSEASTVAASSAPVPACGGFVELAKGSISGSGSASATTATFRGGPQVKVELSFMGPPIPFSDVFVQVIGHPAGFVSSSGSTKLSLLHSFDTISLNKPGCVVVDPAHPVLDEWAVVISPSSFIRISYPFGPIATPFVLNWRILSDWAPGQPPCCP